ncbi:hypothetical protein IMSAGC007_03358 [Lachnospiraceae bacterium]|nr:hypothetical protein IMSAGC007_03358 [Lachnospiraceae bacterium]
MIGLGDIRQADIDAISIHIVQIAEKYILQPDAVKQDIAEQILEVRPEDDARMRIARLLAMKVYKALNENNEVMLNAMIKAAYNGLVERGY